MLEIQLNVVASDIGCHGNDGRAVELADKVTSGNAIQVWHNNVHQDQIVFRAFLDFVDSFETIKLQCS